MLAKEVQDLSSVDLKLDDEISFENEDELNRLEYEGNSEKPLFKILPDLFKELPEPEKPEEKL